MKNKFKLIIILFLLVIFNFNYALSDEFNFEASEIQVLNNGNTLKAKDGVKVISNNNVEIIADEFIYDKLQSLLTTVGNVKFFDSVNGIIIEAEKILYLKKEEKVTAKGKVILVDSVNKINAETEKIFYLINEKKLYSENITNTTIENNIFIKNKSFSYYTDKKEFYSDEKTDLKDNIGNIFSLNKLKFNLNNKIIRGDKINYTDSQSNKYYIEDAMIDLNSNEIIGKDVNIDFNKNTFNNSLNDPRLKANKVYVSKDVTLTSKGVFTTCKKREGCPPWVISAEEIKHDKINKKVYYKNAWLEIYDKPILYFPKFVHPDPTVERQSGFLVPSIYDSNNLGLAIDIPYYKVISENKDLTFKPRFYSNENLILQSEYRQVNKNSKHVFDVGLSNNGGLHNSKGSSSKSHFFSNSIFDLNFDNFDTSSLEVNVASTSNDTYLKTYKIKSPLINNFSSLKSFLTFNAEREDLSINTSVEVYEDLGKSSSDRFEYVYPNFKVKKKLGIIENLNSGLSLTTSGFQKQYNTNISETILINDLLLESEDIITESGFKNNFKYLIKNVNSDSDNSSVYKNSFEQELLTLFSFETSYPMHKINDKSESLLTPTLSMRISPNKTKNILNDDRRIDINNIYSLNRISKEDTIEGGESLTIGAEYKKNYNNNELMSLNLAQVYRFNENDDLPLKSTIGGKSSDIVGNLNIKPNKYLNLNYDFSFDNNLDRSNYDSLKTSLNVNNFVTTFEFLEEKNDIGSESFVSNNTSLKLNNNSSLAFETRKNRKNNLTEFYNLIYEYKNDCLVASLKYNKEYYNDNDLKPEEQFFFSITIVPFGKVDSININQ